MSNPLGEVTRSESMSEYDSCGAVPAPALDKSAESASVHLPRPIRERQPYGTGWNRQRNGDIREGRAASVCDE